MKKRTGTTKATYNDYETETEDTSRYSEDLPEYIPDRTDSGWIEIEDGCYRKHIEPCEY